MKRIAIPTGAAALLLLATTTISAQGTQAPTLTVITPGENQTIFGSKIPILFAVENFEIVDYQTNTKPATGQGHIHLWLDDTKPTLDSAVKLIRDDFTFSDVAFGQHALRAELVGNNHQSLAPPQVVTVNFKSATASSPSPVATSGFDKNTALVILVVVALVIVAAWWYTKEEEETPSKIESPKSKSKKASRKRRK